MKYATLKVLVLCMVLAVQSLVAQDYTITNETTHDQNHFGWYISGAGNHCAISDPRDVISDYGNGSVSLYRRRGGTWRFTHRITPNNPEKHGLFGHKTVMTDSHLAISAIGDSRQGFMAGAVSIYQLQDDAWTLISEVLPERSDDKVQFGAALAMDANYLFVGASGAKNHTGEVYVYAIEGNTVTLLQTIDAPHPVGYEFGKTLQLVGNTLIIGAPSTAKSVMKGGVFVYELMDGVWQKVQDIEPEDEEVGSWFGYAIAADENNLFISAPHNNVPHADGNEYAFAGKVYHYINQGDTWSLNTEILQETPHSHNFFGYQLQVDNGELFISSPNTDGAIKDQGVIYKYTNETGAWTVAQEYRLSDGTKTHLGHSFRSIDGEILAGNGGQKKESNRGTVTVFNDGYVPLSADKLTEPIQVSVYPNPSSERVQIEVDEMRAHKLALFDLNGRQVLTKVFMRRTEIDVSNLNPGLYIISLKTKNQHVSKSLLVR
ncbi:MAG: T9SS type A sorting domain-containing protein [Cytophagales bacterium]|nr:T9SS type A sorting domain-containing protein [Cytophagales bacterium]